MPNFTPCAMMIRKLFAMLLLFLYASPGVHGRLSAADAVSEAFGAGSNTGPIAFMVLGGNEPYLHNWSSRAVTKDTEKAAGGNPATTAAVVPKGTAGGSGEVSQLVPLTVNGTVIHPSCLAKGSISLTASGGTPPYSYVWSTGATQATLANLESGVYAVRVTDTSGGVAETKFQLNSPNLDIYLQTQNTTCSQNGGGVGITNEMGGQPPYTYAWSNGATTKDITGVPAGTYSVTVTDALGCSVTRSATVYSSTSLSLSVQKSDITSCKGTDGTLSLAVIGGQEPYSYTISTAADTRSWATHLSTQNINGLSTGTYTLTVESGGCQVTKIITLQDPVVMSASFAVLPNSSCGGAYNGAVQTQISGGTAPYQYQWSKDGNPIPVFTKDLTGITAGNYTLLITDAQGCTLSASALVPDNLPVYSLNLQKGDVSCPGASDGWILLEMHNGYSYSYVAGYAYASVNAKPVSGTINSLPSGGYTVRAYQEASGCEFFSSITLGEKSALDVRVSVVPVTTCDTVAPNGSIQTTITGGVAPYSYQWADGARTAIRTDLAPGTYQVQVFDAGGCSTNLMEVIVPLEPVYPTITLSSTPNTACGPNATGTIAAGIYESQYYAYSLYQISTKGKTRIQAATQQFSPSLHFANLSSGDYQIEVISANGCSTAANIRVGEEIYIPLIIAATVMPQTGCTSFGEGSAAVVAIDVNGMSASLADFSFLWSDAAGNVLGTGQTLISLPAGTYYVTATKKSNSEDGCSSAPYKVVVPYAPESAGIALTSVPDKSCMASPSGAITATISAATGYSWRWSKAEDASFSITGSQASAASLTNLAAGEYLLTVVATNGCETEASVRVALEAEYPVLNYTKGNVSCNGAQNGWIRAEANPQYHYSWYKDGLRLPLDGANSLEGLAPGRYTIEATTAFGCSAAEEITIIEHDPLHVTESIAPILCAGEPSGSIHLMVTGGVAPFQYLWSHGPTTRDVAGLSAGTYSVTLTDAAGCFLDETFVLQEPTPLTVAAQIQEETNTQLGAIQLSVLGGTAPYTYHWSNGATEASVQQLYAGSYSVTIVDENECTRTESFEVPKNVSEQGVAATRTETGLLQVKINELPQAKELKIFKLDGTLIKLHPLAGEKLLEISLPSAQPGLYLLVVESEGVLYKQKILF